jgi:hypothetical protein
MQMIEVFKTNVQATEEAVQLIGVLQRHFPGSRINIDLHDCDKVLRVEGTFLEAGKIMHVVQSKGFLCSVLD